MNVERGATVSLNICTSLPAVHSTESHVSRLHREAQMIAEFQQHFMRVTRGMFLVALGHFWCVILDKTITIDVTGPMSRTMRDLNRARWFIKLPLHRILSKRSWHYYHQLSNHQIHSTQILSNAESQFWPTGDIWIKTLQCVQLQWKLPRHEKLEGH